LYIATDDGKWSWPQFDVIKAPKVGDKVSQSFNGDSYPRGEIVSVSKSLKLVTTSTGHKFYRRGKSGAWLVNKYASMIPGHVGRDRGRYKHTTDLALACGEGRRDPRDHFLALDAAMPKLMNAIQFANTEPVESRSGWGIWTPQERWVKQTGEHRLVKLDESMRVLFSREQKIWKVRKACLGGSVEGPLVRFPTYFQCAELAHFEGCRVKCYFDPYADEVLGTLVLQDAWAGYPAGHIVASNVPALDLPPQAVIAEDWAGEAEHAKSLAIRKAIAKSVRTEYCNWSGKRTSEARDGMGNIARKTQSQGGGIVNREVLAHGQSEIRESKPTQEAANGGRAQALPYSLRRIMADQAEIQTTTDP
jgi:hypothetical protein